MVAYSLAQRLTPTLALVIAGVLGVLAALGATLLPTPLLESVVLTSGLAAFIPAAEPPLGATARILLGVLAGGGTALIVWFALSMAADIIVRRGAALRGPTVRRGDAHPDAPPREPLRAGRDFGFDLAEPEEDPIVLAEAELPPEPVIALGSPPPSIEPVIEPVVPAPAKPPIVQPLPADLDQPLAAFDPDALPDLPLPPAPVVAPLVTQRPRAPELAQGERLEVFNLAPPPPAAMPIAGPQTEASVHSLLDRLERGITRRTSSAASPADVSEPAPPVEQGLESALENLRRLAVRG